MTISQQDIQQLVREPSPAARGMIATKISYNFNNNGLNVRERTLAVDIFRLLLKDTAVSVRKSIADNLKDNPTAPHDIILALATDDAEAATPVLEFSEVLTEKDILELLNFTDDVKKLLAISRRKNISGEISDKLIKSRNTQVVISLVKNDDAEIYEQSMINIIKDFKGNDSLLDSMVCRGDVSVQFAEHLYSIVSKKLKKQLTRKNILGWSAIDNATTTARDIATVNFLSKCMDEKEMESLVTKMHKNQRLNKSMITRALCNGAVTFFEISMATLAGIPTAHANALLNDKGDDSFNALYQASDMPEGFRDATRVVYKCAQLHLSEKTSISTKKLIQKVVEDMYSFNYHKDVENITYFLSMMGQAKHANTIH